MVQRCEEKQYVDMRKKFNEEIMETMQEGSKRLGISATPDALQASAPNEAACQFEMGDPVSMLEEMIYR